MASVYSLQLLTILLLGIVSQNRVLSEPSICTADFRRGSCVCKLVDGSGTIDLTPLVQQTATNPLQASGSGLGGYKYYFAPCNTLTVPNLLACTNKASSCEYNSQFNYDLGDAQSTRFESRTGPSNPNPSNALVLDATLGGQDNRRTIAFINCDRNKPTVDYTAQGNTGGNTDPDGYFLYYMQLTGSVFCPSTAPPTTKLPPVTTPGPAPGGLSVGSILLIVFFVLLFVYFVGGALILTFGLKKEGRDRVPNHTFWTALPAYAKDGAVYSWHQMKQCISKYQRV